MTRRHLTASGRFEVRRDPDGACIIPYHVATGLTLGGFSHIAVRTFKQALAGIERAEAALSADQWRLIEEPDYAAEWPQATRDARQALVDAMRRIFPNGAWSPRS